MDASITGTLKELGKYTSTTNLPAAKPTRSEQAFSEALKAHADTVPSTLKYEERLAQAEKASGDLVSHALILPMLKQLRRSPWGENTVFSGGIGEKTFGPQFDMQIADRIAHSPRLGIKTALASRYMQRYTMPTQAAKLDTHG